MEERLQTGRAAALSFASCSAGNLRQKGLCRTKRANLSRQGKKEQADSRLVVSMGCVGSVGSEPNSLCFLMRPSAPWGCWFSGVLLKWKPHLTNLSTAWQNVTETKPFGLITNTLNLTEPGFYPEIPLLLLHIKTVPVSLSEGIWGWERASGCHRNLLFHPPLSDLSFPFLFTQTSSTFPHTFGSSALIPGEASQCLTPT